MKHRKETGVSEICSRRYVKTRQKSMGGLNLYTRLDYLPHDKKNKKPTFKIHPLKDIFASCNEIRPVGLVVRDPDC